MSLENNDKLHQHILYENRFTYGEADKPGCPPTGMILDISQSNLLNTFHSIALRHSEYLRNLKFQRAYVNLFTPNERPYFHNDGQVITNLFYINPPYDEDEGGETQFLIDQQIVGVLARPARLVVFDGMLTHRATSFRTRPRITVALKYIKV